MKRMLAILLVFGLLISSFSIMGSAAKGKTTLYFNAYMLNGETVGETTPLKYLEKNDVRLIRTLADGQKETYLPEMINAERSAMKFTVPDGEYEVYCQDTWGIMAIDEMNPGTIKVPTEKGEGSVTNVYFDFIGTQVIELSPDDILSNVGMAELTLNSITLQNLHNPTRGGTMEYNFNKGKYRCFVPVGDYRMTINCTRNIPDGVATNLIIERDVYVSGKPNTQYAYSVIPVVKDTEVNTFKFTVTNVFAGLTKRPVENLNPEDFALRDINTGEVYTGTAGNERGSFLLFENIPSGTYYLDFVLPENHALVYLPPFVHIFGGGENSLDMEVTLGETFDFTGDGLLDVSDYQLVVNNAVKDTGEVFMSGPVVPSEYDINGDGILDVLDVSVFEILINGDFPLRCEVEEIPEIIAS